MIGWMNNWQYGRPIPTSPWRSAMSVPRELSLRDIDGARGSCSSPSPARDTARRAGRPPASTARSRGAPHRCPHGARRSGSTRRCVRAPPTSYGLKVRTGDGQQTVIGYDGDSAAVRRPHPLRRRQLRPHLPRASSARRYRTQERHRAPAHARRLVLGRGLRRGRQGVLITDQIFPAPASTGLAAFATGGTATLRSITVSHMRSAWTGRTS